LAIVSNVVKIKFFCHLPDKSGCPPESSVELVKHIMDECPSLQFSGIMTIGALARSVQQEETNEDFDVGSLNCRIQEYNAYKSFIYLKFESIRPTDNITLILKPILTLDEKFTIVISLFLMIEIFVLHSVSTCLQKKHL
jgi:hypothetical protein